MNKKDVLDIFLVMVVQPSQKDLQEQVILKKEAVGVMKALYRVPKAHRARTFSGVWGYSPSENF